MEKASHKANVQCAEDIGKAINSYFDGFHYHTGFEKELIETYGMEQVKYVVAYNIQQKLNDGNIFELNVFAGLLSALPEDELMLYRKKLKDQQPKSLEEAIYEI